MMNIKEILNIRGYYQLVTKPFIRILSQTVLSSVLVNLLFLYVVKLFIHAPSTFSPFFYSLVGLYTGLGVLASGAVFIFLKRISPRYHDLFTWISLIVLILSMIPDIQLYTNPGDADNMGATIPIVIVLMITHIIAGYFPIHNFASKDL